MEYKGIQLRVYLGRGAARGEGMRETAAECVYDHGGVTSCEWLRLSNLNQTRRALVLLDNKYILCWWNN